ncbi:DegT/DnrJ/EryC1/StrS family aminotransferase [Plantactinospora mayteni]|nr:DegT/DnrJ/EryC1/StrS family aminotransferase [Plantactinospora mayteni]
MTTHLGPAARLRIAGVLERHEPLSEYYGGPWARRFEDEFARYHGADRHAVAVNSGTSALHVSLAAAGIGPGDEVIVPALAFVAAATAVVQLGAVPVICDAEPHSLTMDVRAAEALVTDRTRAILPVHLWGHPADLASLRALCDARGLVLVEDACQAPGAPVGAARTGTFGDFAAYSFANRKHIHCGDGGMVLCRTAEAARTVRSMANFGKGPGWDDYHTLGYNYRMVEVSALIGLEGLADLDDEIARRQHAASLYRQGLRDTDLAPVPAPAWGDSVYFKMPVLLPERHVARRQFVIDAIHAENVSSRIPHRPLFAVPWLAEYLRARGRYRGPEDCRVAASAHARLFEVETGPHLPAEEAARSVEAVRKVWRQLDGQAP